MDSGGENATLKNTREPYYITAQKLVPVTERLYNSVKGPRSTDLLPVWVKVKKPFQTAIDFKTK